MAVLSELSKCTNVQQLNIWWSTHISPAPCTITITSHFFHCIDHIFTLHVKETSDVPKTCLNILQYLFESINVEELLVYYDNLEGLFKSLLSLCLRFYDRSCEEWSYITQKVFSIVYFLCESNNELCLKIMCQMSSMLLRVIIKDCDHVKSASLAVFYSKCLQTGNRKMLQFVEEHYSKHLAKLTEQIVLCGDYFTQLACVEILHLLHISKTRTQKKASVRHWFPGEEFESVRKLWIDLKFDNFENDCRQFLNTLNKIHNRLYSISCEDVFLFTSKVYTNYEETKYEFYIDINLGSQTLTCQFDSEEYYRNVSIPFGDIKRITYECFDDGSNKIKIVLNKSEDSSQYPLQELSFYLTKESSNEFPPQKLSSIFPTSIQFKVVRLVNSGEIPCTQRVSVINHAFRKINGNSVPNVIQEVSPGRQELLVKKQCLFKSVSDSLHMVCDASTDKFVAHLPHKQIIFESPESTDSDEICEQYISQSLKNSKTNTPNSKLMISDNVDSTISEKTLNNTRIESLQSNHTQESEEIVTPKTSRNNFSGKTNKSTFTESQSSILKNSGPEKTLRESEISKTLNSNTSVKISNHTQVEESEEKNTSKTSRSNFSVKTKRGNLVESQTSFVKSSGPAKSFIGSLESEISKTLNSNTSVKISNNSHVEESEENVTSKTSQSNFSLKTQKSNFTESQTSTLKNSGFIGSLESEYSTTSNSNISEKISSHTRVESEENVTSKNTRSNFSGKTQSNFIESQTSTLKNSDPGKTLIRSLESEVSNHIQVEKSQEEVSRSLQSKFSEKTPKSSCPESPESILLENLNSNASIKSQAESISSQRLVIVTDDDAESTTSVEIEVDDIEIPASKLVESSLKNLTEIVEVIDLDTPEVECDVITLDDTQLSSVPEEYVKKTVSECTSTSEELEIPAAVDAAEDEVSVLNEDHRQSPILENVGHDENLSIVNSPTPNLQKSILDFTQQFQESILSSTILYPIEEEATPEIIDISEVEKTPEKKDITVYDFIPESEENIKNTKRNKKSRQKTIRSRTKIQLKKPKKVINKRQPKKQDHVSMSDTDEEQDCCMQSMEITTTAIIHEPKKSCIEEFFDKAVEENRKFSNVFSDFDFVKRANETKKSSSTSPECDIPVNGVNTLMDRTINSDLEKEAIQNNKRDSTSTSKKRKLLPKNFEPDQDPIATQDLEYAMNVKNIYSSSVSDKTKKGNSVKKNLFPEPTNESTIVDGDSEQYFKEKPKRGRPKKYENVKPNKTRNPEKKKVSSPPLECMIEFYSEENNVALKEPRIEELMDMSDEDIRCANVVEDLDSSFKIVEDIKNNNSPILKCIVEKLEMVPIEDKKVSLPRKAKKSQIPVKKPRKIKKSDVLISREPSPQLPDLILEKSVQAFSKDDSLNSSFGRKIQDLTRFLDTSNDTMDVTVVDIDDNIHQEPEVSVQEEPLETPTILDMVNMDFTPCVSPILKTPPNITKSFSLRLDRKRKISAIENEENPIKATRIDDQEPLENTVADTPNIPTNEPRNDSPVHDANNDSFNRQQSPDNIEANVNGLCHLFFNQIGNNILRAINPPSIDINILSVTHLLNRAADDFTKAIMIVINHTKEQKGQARKTI